MKSIKKSAKIKTLIFAASFAPMVVMASNANAQTLNKFAPPETIFSLEMNDWAGARKTASSFVKKIEELKLIPMLFKEMNPTELADLESLIEREGMVSMSLNTKTGMPSMLMAARPTAGSDAKIKSWIARSLNDAKKNKTKITSGKIAGFPYYSDGETNYGTQGGLVYASTDLNALGGFLRRVAGKESTSLAGVQNYKNIMSKVGPGLMRMYVDVSNVGRSVSSLLDAENINLGNIKLAPMIQALVTIGRFGSAMKVTPEGISSTTFSQPNPNADKDFYAAWQKTPILELNAAQIVPANALSFYDQSLNPTAWYNALNKLVDASKLNPGGLDRLFTRELGFDVRRSLLPALTGEFASATFAAPRSSNTDAGRGELMQQVYYIGASDEKAVQSALDAVVPRLSEVVNSLTENNNGQVAKPQRQKLAGYDITRYSLAPNVAIVSAAKDGYLILALSDDAMVTALGSGPRLAESERFQKARERLPSDAQLIGFGFGDQAQQLRVINGELSGIALSQGLNFRPSEARKISESVKAMIDFTVDRVGDELSYTVKENDGWLTRGLIPVRW